MKKQDKTPVLINLVSTIRDEEGEQEAPMQLFCRGELKKTASGYLIRYQESMPTEDDSEMERRDSVAVRAPRDHEPSRRIRHDDGVRKGSAL